MPRDCIFRVSSVLVFICLLLFFYQASAVRDKIRWFPPGKVIAVDIGNTNSCVAGYGRGEAETMFQLCIPSWVAFPDNGTVLVGEEARNHAAVDSEAAIFGLKRLLGRRWESWGVVQRVIDTVPYKMVENNMHPHIQVKTKQFGVDQITAMVVARLKEAAEAYLGHRVRHAVFTLPQHYHEEPKGHALHAGHIARLKPMRVLDEPIAAAVAYGLHRKLREEGNVLVLHVGGFTSEASVLTFTSGVFDFLGAHYDALFGGGNFDQRIMDYFAELIREKHGRDISNDNAALWKLRTACEHAKKVLSTKRYAQLSIESLVDGLDFSEMLTRAKFEELNNDLFLQIVEFVDRAMVSANLESNKATIDEIVLIGGSTMIPKIQELIKDYFGGKEPHTRLKPDEVITFGAALLSHPTTNGYPCMGVDNRHQFGYESDWCYTCTY